MNVNANTVAMIQDAFNMQTYDPNQMDVQHTPLYDSVTFAAAATITPTTSAFFTNVGPASAKTLAQTNLANANRLASPETFSIFGVRLRWSEGILRADLDSILGNAATVGFALSLTLGQKKYQLAPLWYFGAGGGISGFTTRTDESAYTNGLPSRESMHKLAIPIVIENNMTFSANFEGNNFVLAAAVAGGVGATFVLLLDGLYARGIQ
jgi:hypothetical protein